MRNARLSKQVTGCVVNGGEPLPNASAPGHVSGSSDLVSRATG